MYFAKMQPQETPKYLWIGKSRTKLWKDTRVVWTFGNPFSHSLGPFTGSLDLRIPAHEIMGKEAKDVLVYNNVANMISHTDMSLSAALQDAVASGIHSIVVCGHYDCAAIRGAPTPRDPFNPVNVWTSSVNDA